MANGEQAVLPRAGTHAVHSRVRPFAAVAFRCMGRTREGAGFPFVTVLCVSRVWVCGCVCVLSRVGVGVPYGIGVQDGVLPSMDGGQQRNWTVQEENDWLRAVSPFHLSASC